MQICNINNIQPNFSGLKIRLEPEIRLPFEYVKGSESERFARAEKLTDNLFEAIKDLFTKESPEVPVKIIKEKMQKILPKPLAIEITGISDKNKLTTDTIGRTFHRYYDEQGTRFITGVGICMPLTNDGKIRAENINTLLHEFRHIMDSTFNPKIEMRGYSLVANGNPFKKLISNYLNTDGDFDENLFAAKLNEQMSELSDEQIINALQGIRYSLKTEINAYYDSTFKYQAMINKKLGIEKSLPTSEYISSKLKLKEKLFSVSEELNKTIYEIRQLHKKELKKQKRTDTKL